MSIFLRITLECIEVCETAAHSERITIVKSSVSLCSQNGTGLNSEHMVRSYICFCCNVICMAWLLTVVCCTQNVFMFVVIYDL